MVTLKNDIAVMAWHHSLRHPCTMKPHYRYLRNSNSNRISNHYYILRNLKMVVDVDISKSDSNNNNNSYIDSNSDFSPSPLPLPLPPHHRQL